MSPSLRRRLTFSHLTVALLGMVLAGILTGLAVERVYLGTQRENLLAQAQLIAAGVIDEELPAGTILSSDPYSQTTNIQPGIHTRLLADSGMVLFSLPLDGGSGPVRVPLGVDPGIVTAEELLERSEIKAALAGRAQTVVRRPTAAGSPRRVLYAAAPVRDGDGEISGLVYLAMPLPAGGLPPQLLLQLAGAVLLGGLVAGSAGIWLSGELSRPLETMERAAGAIAAGDLEMRVPDEAPARELASLGETFNRMAAQLQRGREIQNGFIADVTHELRTPLTVIKGTVETMEEGAWDDLESRERLLASMHSETDRLIRLVNDLLTLTRADADALNLHLQLVDLLQFTEERCRQLAPLASEKGMNLETVCFGEGPFWVDADRDRLAQVLDNLLDNAIRHSPEGAVVTAGISRQDALVSCSVRDRGAGIPAEHLPRIFERFYRLDRARDRREGGAGLGLAIACSLIDAQGGDIRAESSPGKGTAVIFSLPAAENCHRTD